MSKNGTAGDSPAIEVHGLVKVYGKSQAPRCADEMRQL